MDLRFLFGHSFPLTSKPLVVLEVVASGSGTDLVSGVGPRLSILGMLEVDAFGSSTELGSRLGMPKVDASGSGTDISSGTGPRLGKRIGLVTDSIGLGLCLVSGSSLDSIGSDLCLGSGLDSSPTTLTKPDVFFCSAASTVSRYSIIAPWFITGDFKSLF